jgi:hypothetical protein
MFETTLSIANVYFRRGSVREAEYFVRESERFARSMNAPAMLCRALALQVELQLQLRQLDTALTTLRAATDVLNDMKCPDAAGLHKLRGEYNELLLQDQDARVHYGEALKMLEELGKTFSGLGVPTRYGSSLRRLNCAQNSLGDQAFRRRFLSGQRGTWSHRFRFFSPRF